MKMSLIAAVAIMVLNDEYKFARTKGKTVFIKDEEILEKIKKEKGLKMFTFRKSCQPS